MDKVHVCDCLLDLAIYWYKINPYVIPERDFVVRKLSVLIPDLMLTLDRHQYEWNILVACCPYCYSYHLESVSIDVLVPTFQLNYTHTWHEASNWDSSSSDNDSNLGDFYTAIDKEMIKDAKTNSTICYFKYDKNWDLFCPHCKSFLLREFFGKLHLVASDIKKEKR